MAASFMLIRGIITYSMSSFLTHTRPLVMRKPYGFISGFTILGKSFFNVRTAFLSSLVMAAASFLHRNHYGEISVSLSYFVPDFQ